MTATIGEWDIQLDLSEQFLPSEVTSRSVELFYQSIMGRSIS